VIDRQVRDFVRTARGVQSATGVSMEQAKLRTALILGTPMPSDAEFNMALIEPPAKKGRGRVRSEGLSKRDAVAALAAHFESIGAGAEQAINEAKRWLNITVSRRVAKAAVAAFKANTATDQFKVQALWAYGTYRPGTRLPLPESFVKVRKKRQGKSDLG